MDSQHPWKESLSHASTRMWAFLSQHQLGINNEFAKWWDSHKLTFVFNPQRTKGLELSPYSRYTDMPRRYRKHKGNGKPRCGWRSLTLTSVLPNSNRLEAVPSSSLPLTDLCKPGARILPEALASWIYAFLPASESCWATLGRLENSSPLLWTLKPYMLVLISCHVYNFYPRDTYFSILFSTPFGNYIQTKTLQSPHSL